MGTKSEESSWSREEEETHALRERDALRLVGSSILSEDISRVREDLDMIVCRFLASKGWEMTPYGWTKAIGDMTYSCASSSALAVQSVQDRCDPSEIDSVTSRDALRSAAESRGHVLMRLSDDKCKVGTDEEDAAHARVALLLKSWLRAGPPDVVVAPAYPPHLEPLSALDVARMCEWARGLVRHRTSASEFEAMVRDDERNRCSARVKALVEESNGRSMFIDIDLVIEAIKGSEVSGG